MYAFLLDHKIVDLTSMEDHPFLCVANIAADWMYLNISLRAVLFPEPVLPTNAKVLPPSSLKLTFLSTGETGE